MAWLDSWQDRKQKFPDINEQLASIKGYIEEDEAKVLMYKFMYENVSYGVEFLMGVRLFEFQHIMIKAMMVTDYFMGILSRGCGKSYISGIFIAYYALLHPGTEIGIISRTFRQAKHIFKKIEDVANSKKGSFLKQCIINMTKSSDEWLMEIGTSKIRALPLGDGEKLRGFRFHVVVIDEFLLMPEPIYNSVIKPFLSTVPNPDQRKELADLETELIELGKMKESERYVWSNNKLITLSSAGYTFDYIYKLYKQYEKLILEGTNSVVSAHRTIMHFSYDVVPKELYDQNLIQESKETMSEAQFTREFGSIFTDDSSSFFKISKMASVTYEDGSANCVELVGDPKAKYILSVDPSWAETDSSDDFAMHVIKLTNDGERGTVVHSYAIHGGQPRDHIKYFHFLLTHFNVVFIVMDYMGGSQFIKSVNESKLFQNEGIEINTIEAKELDDISTYSKGLRKTRAKYNQTTGHICYLRKPSSQWIRFANELLQAHFDKNIIWFAGAALDSHWKKQLRSKIPITQLKPFNKSDEQLIEEDSVNEQAAGLKNALLERLVELLDQTKAQCAMIMPTSTPNGTQTFDLPPNLKKTTGENKVRKDSYSALVLGNWGLKLYYDLKTKEDKVETDFVPFMF